MIALTEFLPLILPEAAGCPEPLAVQAVRQTIREVCLNTQIWVEPLGPVPIREGWPSYSLMPPEGTEVAMLLSVRLNNLALIPTTEPFLDANWPGWSGYSGGRPSHYFLEKSATIRLVPIPVASPSGKQELTARAALLPATNATEVWDELWTRHGRTIAHGALEHLQAIPGKIWNDVQAATRHGALFRRGCANIRAEALKARGTASLAAHPRSFVA